MVKYVKAEAFKKHEKLRDLAFEKKLSELTSFNQTSTYRKQQDFAKENRHSNLHWQLIENSNGIEYLNNESVPDEDKPVKDDEFIIAQQYGSFDEEDNLNSAYSSMKGDSISGDFNLEIVGSKVEIHQQDGQNAFVADKPNNVSQFGSKITFGEPSGDVFGLFFENQCSGIFKDDADHEFLPVNTLPLDD